MRVGAALAVAVVAILAPSVQPPEEAGVAPGVAVPDLRPGEAFADPKVAELQRTATDVQRELGSLAEEIHAAQSALTVASGALAGARVERARADEAVAARQADVDRYASAILGSFGGPSQLQVLLLARSPDDFLDGSSLMARLAESETSKLAAAVSRRHAAVSAEHAAASAEKNAADRKNDLDRRNSDASNRAAAITGEFRGKLAETNAAVVAQQQAQRDRNAQTTANWRTYTDKLAAAGIRPQAQAREVTLPSGERLLVSATDTINAITAAIGALGKPYVPGKGDGPDAYSCDGLARSIYGLTGSAADQMAVLQPVTEPQPGDLVFLGPARYGVQSVGVVLDGRTMITADARLVGVVVADVPADVLGFARPVLPRRPAQPVPQRTDNGLKWRCGGVDLPSGAWSGYPNGLIPAAALCAIGEHRLRCDAAQGFQGLSAAFGSAFGRPVCLTDSYRTFDEQVRLYGVKPALAAVPGTSNHGWGLAVDMCGGVQSFGSAEYRWLMANAARFGWVNPAWAWPGRGREEPWHWEFGPLS